MTAREQIAQIDRLIDANRIAIFNRLHCVPLTAFDWGRAWRRCPDLRARDHELFRERGRLQDIRDAEDHKAWLAQERKERAEQRARVRASIKNRRPCPTCGSLVDAA